MHVLVTGATGFVGRHVCARLLTDGHRITAIVRDPRVAARRFPGITAIRGDLNRMTDPWDWRPLLAGVDAVVNCAGILQARRGQSAEAIHTRAPNALFDACVAVGVRRVVQISAVSADPRAGTAYAITKAAADAHLRSLDLDWIVLRPSLVYGQGSYGGTSFLRGLAGLPGIVPLIGKGGQAFQPIHVDDLAEAVSRCLAPSFPPQQTLEPVGPETLTLREMTEMTRAWLDIPPARFLAVPLPLVRLMAQGGDLLGAGPVTSTSLAQMEYGNVADPVGFAAAIGFQPRAMSQAFQMAPSHVQDRWHARLYFIPPLLTVILALLWIGSGVAGLTNPPTDALIVTMAVGAPPEAVPWIVGLFCLIDIGIGVWLATGRAGRLCGWVQGTMVVGYTVGMTLFVPSLWYDPYGALLKNLPTLGAILVWLALLDDR